MPDFAAAIKKIREEQPEQADVPIEPTGFFGRMLGGNKALATTSPWTGSISYNPEVMKNLSPPEIENTMAHELTHSRQIQNTPYFNRFTNVVKSMMGDEPYYERPREMEAFQAERDRSQRLGLDLPDPITGNRDIELPPMSPRRKVMSMFTNDRIR